MSDPSCDQGRDRHPSAAQIDGRRLRIEAGSEEDIVSISSVDGKENGCSVNKGEGSPLQGRVGGA